MKTTNKSFDAVAFMRQQREALSAKLSKMTKEEVVAYFKKRSAESQVKPCTSF
jgi:c-di-AMP phosphodiesterase-like protein